MVTATINSILDLSKSFYARVGDDYRLYIPREFREVMKIEPGDMMWIIVGTVLSKKSRVVMP
jgi:bifunctional DNA-binding transcriptional regulator/antitoxin component of YhaV-PrlF toxin-antitoxin module